MCNFDIENSAKSGTFNFGLFIDCYLLHISMKGQFRFLGTLKFKMGFYAKWCFCNQVENRFWEFETELQFSFSKKKVKKVFFFYKNLVKSFDTFNSEVKWLSCIATTNSKNSYSTTRILSDDISTNDFKVFILLNSCSHFSHMSIKCGNLGRKKSLREFGYVFKNGSFSKK